MHGKTQKSRFTPKNPHKYAGDVTAIVCRSSWERKFCIMADENPAILKWNSEEVVIPYWSSVDGKMRRYFPDFLVKIKKKDGTLGTVLIEVKPHLVLGK